MFTKLLLSFFLLTMTMVPSLHAKGELDSLRAEFHRLSDTGKEAQAMPIARSLGVYWRGKNGDSSLYYFDRFIALAEAENNIPAVARGYQYKGYTYAIQDNLELQLESYQKALAILNRNQLQAETHTVLGNIASVFSNAGFYVAAKEYLLRQLKVIEASQDSTLTPSGTLGNLGFTYIELAKKDPACLDTAYFFFQSGLEEEIELGRPPIQAFTHDYLGELELIRNNPDKAASHYRKELEILNSRPGGNHGETLVVFEGRAHYGLAKVYAQTNNVDSVFKHTALAEEVWDQLVLDLQTPKLAKVKMLNAEAYEHLGQPQLADRMIDQALELAEQVNKNKGLLSSIYKRIALVKSKRGEYAGAYQYLDKHRQLKEEILLLADNSFYAANYSKMVNTVLESELEQKKQENIQAITVRNWSIGTAIGASTLLILFLLLFRNLRKSHRLNQQYANELLRANQTKDKLMSVLGHDLRGPFQSIMGISQQGKREIQKGDWQKAINSLKVIGETSREMYHLFENLLEWAKTQSGEIPFQPQELDLAELIEETLVVCQVQAEAKQVHIEGRFIEQKLWGDPLMVRTILRNLVSNAIKFSPQGGFVNILAEQQTDRMGIWIEDLGPGMDAREIELIMTGSNISSRNNGLGLVLCREFLAPHGSNLLLESSKGKGSRIGFYLDLSDRAIDQAKSTEVTLDLSHSSDLPLVDISEKIGQYCPDLFEKLQGLKIYQSSKARTILKELESFNFTGLNAWKSQLFIAMEHFDEAEFQRLIGKSDQNSSQILGNPV